MSYKTILVHVEASELAESCIETAARLAIREQAHLIGASMTGISRFVDNEQRAVFKREINALTDKAHQSLEAFQAICERAGLASYEGRLIDDDAAAGLVSQAPYCDLIMLGRPAASPLQLASDSAEYVMLHAARPVLALPAQHRFDLAGAPILVAWNGSPEAARAATFALPLLKMSEKVTVALFQPRGSGESEEQDMLDVASWLARHGVKTEVVQNWSEKDAAEAMLALAAERHAGLLVMGGYGHPRVREMMLGGVTHKVLRKAVIPLFLAH